MKKLMQMPFWLVTMERKWLMPLIASTLISIILILAATLSLGVASHGMRSSVFQFLPLWEEGHAQFIEEITEEEPAGSLPPAPRFAYLISGTKGDGSRMQRVLQALYHPRNYYLLHLDLEAPTRERIELARYVRNQPAFAEAQNVYVVGKANLVTYRGPTMIAATLHGAAILLRRSKDWDWFINLSASDYPLITQDDLLHVFSYLPKDLNFIEHTSDIGWKETQGVVDLTKQSHPDRNWTLLTAFYVFGRFQRAKPIIIDPGLYMDKKTDIFWATQRRAVPSSFRLFTELEAPFQVCDVGVVAGSAWVVLTRSFMEYCIQGYDNLPRTLLMYYTNFVSSPEGYFHTVLCNSQEFRNTTVNHDLHYITWDTPPRQHPLSLTVDDLQNMTASGAAFARKFDYDDPVLDKIDKTLLQRPKGKFTPGGWCIGTDTHVDPCSIRGESSVLRPGPGARRFEDLVFHLLSPSMFRSQQCISPQ